MTFSIVARCLRTRALGVVTCSTGRAIGSCVPHAREGVGAIATQAIVNIFHGKHGLRLLQMGYDPRRVLQSSLAVDPHPEFRQVLIIDSNGRTAAHTGLKTTDWKGHIEGSNYVVGGNNLVGPQVLETMITNFEETEEKPLHERLIRVIAAGEEAGGCNQPNHNAALFVVGINEALKIFSRPVLNLRVDSSDDPTSELKTVYARYKAFIQERRQDPKNIHGFS